jgi:monoamine oxidase
VRQTLDADVVVVGAGFAGLTAAQRLIEEGWSAVVLEARDRVGGRVLNHDLGDRRVVEVGGQWIGPGQSRMYALAETFGIDTFPTYDTGEDLALIDGKAHRFTGDLPRINPIVLADFSQAFLRLERMAKKVPADVPWEAPKARTHDSMTLETWIRRNLRTSKARRLMRLFVAAVFAAEPADFSLLHALAYIHSGVSFDSLIRTAGGAQQDRFVGGSQRLTISMADKLSDAVRLSSPVGRITYGRDVVTVAAGAEEVRCRRAVVTVPPALAARIAYEPPLPPARDQLTQRMPQGSVTKVMAVYDHPFWRDEGLSGQAGSPDLPLSFTFDNSPPEGIPGVLVGFLEGDKARRFSSADEADRRKVVLDSFSRYFGDTARSCEQYIELDWSAEEWTRGCYGAHLPPGVWTSYGKALRASCGPVHWAGTETAGVFAGYMEGAVASGERVAAEVGAALGAG